MIFCIVYAKKLADAFNVTMDYPVDDTGKLMGIKEKTVLERIMEIERLEKDEKKRLSMSSTVCLEMPRPEEPPPNNRERDYA